MKNFKELSENHDDGYEPRSKGEKEFKSIHKIEKKQHPTVDDAVFNGDRPGGKVNKSDHKTSSKEPGEPILKTYKNFMKLGGFGGDSYKNVGNSAGEKAAIMQGSSKIKEGLELTKSDKTKVLDEIYASGTKVIVPHKGKMVLGKVVRYDKGGKYGSPFYVVDVGEYESLIVPTHHIMRQAHVGDLHYRGTYLAPDRYYKESVEILDENDAPPIHVRSLYAQTYAKHGKTVAQSKTARELAYRAVEKKHGSAMRKKLSDYHAKNRNEEVEQIDELSKGTKDAYVAKRGAQLSSMMYGPKKNYNLLTGRQQANAVKGIKRATRVKEENEVSEEIVNEMNYKAGDLKLNSGEIVKISDSAASALNNTFKRLSLANKVNFHKELIKNKDSYQSIMYFAQRIGGGGAWRHSASAIKARQLPDPAK